MGSRCLTVSCVSQSCAAMSDASFIQILFCFFCGSKHIIACTKFATNHNVLGIFNGDILTETDRSVPSSNLQLLACNGRDLP